MPIGIRCFSTLIKSFRDIFLRISISWANRFSDAVSLFFVAVSIFDMFCLCLMLVLVGLTDRWGITLLFPDKRHVLLDKRHGLSPTGKK